ncbi:MAG: putative phage tail protein [Clostridium sp.]
MLLKDMIPPVLLDIYEIRHLLSVIQDEVDALDVAREDLLNQYFISTATWGLDLWESMYNIPTDKLKPVEFRRTAITAKKRGQGTTTKALVKNVSESFANGEVDVIEDSNEFRIIIKFIGVKGTPPNIDDLKKALQQVIPSHLELVYEFTYNTWDMIEAKGYTSEELEISKLSWDMIAEMELRKGVV